ncbi:MAG: dihydrofolate reductase [Bacteroidota bacterium]
MIVAAAKNGVIGNDNQMPWHLPNDFKFFREQTTGHPVIMGRKTFQSIGKPLPGRTNIVISSGFSADGITVVPDLDRALELGHMIDADPFVIGGASVYRQAYPKADQIFLTLVETELQGDATFDLPDENEWELVSEEAHEADERHKFGYSFLIYRRK